MRCISNGKFKFTQCGRPATSTAQHRAERSARVSALSAGGNDVQAELLPEEWGGDTPFVEISAKKGTGIDELLETVALVAELEELVANPERDAEGTVLESHLDKRIGPICSLLVQTGTLRVRTSDPCGCFWLLHDICSACAHQRWRESSTWLLVGPPWKRLWAELYGTDLDPRSGCAEGRRGASRLVVRACALVPEFAGRGGGGAAEYRRVSRRPQHCPGRGRYLPRVRGRDRGPRRRGGTPLLSLLCGAFCRPLRHVVGLSAVLPALLAW